MNTHEIIQQNESLWELYTRKEEYNPQKLDKYGRFDFSHNPETYVTKPKVSQFLIENGLEITYPDEKTFAVCLTHDIDDVYPPIHHTLLSSVYCSKTLDFKKLNSFLFWKFRGKHESPYRNFTAIMKLEEKYEAKSSFYFLATDKDIRRFRYNIEDLDSDLGMIIDNGFEVGLHGGFYAFNSCDQIKREKERLEKIINRDIIGYRNHYLRFKLPDTWEILASLNIKYDTTLGYYDRVGFRNGMCHPFKPYNVNLKREIDIFEIPLVIMDGALFGKKHPPERVWQTAKQLIDTTKQCKGVVTLLWHNMCFNSPFQEERVKLYEKILQYCNKEGALITSGQDILNIYKENQIFNAL